ncbi:hypothetical protein [Anoxybacteroides amylolyticum]|uniref:Uncharacterized protein n=1 Tax=Anoxybacteroides amylolyticum TaxID=294699 RepID=A0A167TSG4_9BACL|nr:hypothetical protein [Anoxybacillus amylolyticus]ANB62144.1 hypothetical protein GFC30_2997 [Anoxybacillus amylolyticus]
MKNTKYPVTAKHTHGLLDINKNEKVCDEFCRKIFFGTPKMPRNLDISTFLEGGMVMKELKIDELISINFAENTDVFFYIS